MARKLVTMDGNNAAAHVSYAFTEVAAIYPITPSSPMADLVDQWAAAGRKNIFGTKVRVQEMQAESGAAGAVHGSLNAGALPSHEIQKIAVWDYDDLAEMVDMDAVNAFRQRGLNPQHPQMRGSHENGDIFFQNREASNKYYDAVPDLVEEYMGKINAKIGTNYQLFNYYGAPDADRVIISMGSICDVAEEVIDYLNAHGEKVGLVKVRLYRPFRADKLIAAIPATCKKIAVLDRTKEPGAQGEPLYLDVVTALANAGRNDIVVTGGRYGLGSKDTPPSSVFAVYEELKRDTPKRQFTIGIVDDVTNLSLPETDDSKKTGGVTISHLRFGDHEIKSPYYINKADFVACHNPSYITKGFKMVQDVKPGGVFMINCEWTPEELSHHLDASAKRYIAKNNIQLYTINAIDLAI